MDTQYRRIEEEVKREFFNSHFFAIQFGYFAIATLTAPFTTLGVSLQLSSMKLEKFYGDPGHEVSRLELAKSHALKVQERSFNEVQLSSGVVGNNRPFRAPFYRNYKEAFSALSAQGYKGFYKGNFLDICRNFVVSSPMLWVSYLNFYRDSGPLRPFLLFTLSMTAECVAQPLHNMQSRFILQNRIPEFTLYRSIFACAETLRLRGLYQGLRVVVPKHSLAFFFTSTFGPSLTAQILFLLTEVLVYPLDTVQRRLEVQGKEHSMLPRRYLNHIRFTFSRILDEEGVFKGLYRGAIMNIFSNYLKYMTLPIFTYFYLNYNQISDFAKENIRD
jgi:hypothetical protein